MSDVLLHRKCVDKTRPSRAAIVAKGWLPANKWLILRRLSQGTFLAVFLSGPILGFWIAKGTLASSMTFGVFPLTDPLIALQALIAGHVLASTALIGAAIVIAVYALIGGRAYCSWVCPINPLTDFANWIHRRLGLKKGWQPKRTLRFWVLAMVLIASLLTGTIFWEAINPITTLHRELIFGTLWTSGFASLLVVSILAFDTLISRHGFCGHLCPVGAFYGLLGRFRIPAISAAARSKCDDCMLCFAVCPEPHVISPALQRGGKHEKSPLITNVDCTLCGRCADVCPHSVFRFSTRFDERLQPVEPVALPEAA
jgi:ferredoxin-type protein NapH